MSNHKTVYSFMWELSYENKSTHEHSPHIRIMKLNHSLKYHLILKRGINWNWHRKGSQAKAPNFTINMSSSEFVSLNFQQTYQATYSKWIINTIGTLSRHEWKIQISTCTCVGRWNEMHFESIRNYVCMQRNILNGLLVMCHVTPLSETAETSIRFIYMYNELDS